jgi:hypothetical protein
MSAQNLRTAVLLALAALLAFAPGASAITSPILCSASLTVITEDNGDDAGTYHFDVTSDHTCIGTADGFLILDFGEGGPNDVCSGVGACSIHLEGDVPLGSCFHATATGNSVLPYISATADSCGP